MSNFWIDVWQQITNQVCKCKHTKRHHIKLGKEFSSRSDVQCLDWIFTGGAFGEHGSLSCCQCLSYNQREFSLKRFVWMIKQYVRSGGIVLPEIKDFHCVCGHSALDHDIDSNFKELYPPCNKCNCKEYDYVNNPKIGDAK